MKRITIATKSINMLGLYNNYYGRIHTGVPGGFPKLVNSLLLIL